MVEFALWLMRKDMEMCEKLSLRDVTEITLPYYAEGSIAILILLRYTLRAQSLAPLQLFVLDWIENRYNLTDFVDISNEDFYEYSNYNIFANSNQRPF